MKIKVLIENTAARDLQCEHGLSLYIEYEGEKILLDTGSTEAFAENAKQMDVDLAAVDMAFLSHGHYDHSGGFNALFKTNKRAPVYAMETALARYASASGGVLHEIGVAPLVKTNLKERQIPVREAREITKGITLVPHSTAPYKLAAIGEKAGLYREVKEGHRGEKSCIYTGGDKAPGHWASDDFGHEMSVVFETPAGLVICNSCSHGGVRNIIEEVKAVLPGKKIYAYVGGLHMKGSKDGEEICTFTEEEVKETADYIDAAGIEVLLTGHCTGRLGFALLKKHLKKGQLLQLCTGTVFELGEA